MSPETQAAVATLLAIETVAPAGMKVARHHHLALAALLRDHGYTFYVTCCASHWPAQVASKAAPESAEHFEVATVLRRPVARGADVGGSTTFAWRVEVPADGALDSLALLFAGADWQEREQYDLVGVRFGGHPDLRRLMMDED
ncbi:MAG: NADH-quinone oxidoreductase subunit C, partial [Myxococcales bacterium]|nr:NADH-quinone oxidoreductase subunit C [Myxococcales bacterium]